MDGRERSGGLIPVRQMGAYHGCWIGRRVLLLGRKEGLRLCACVRAGLGEWEVWPLSSGGE